MTGSLRDRRSDRPDSLTIQFLDLSAAFRTS